MRERGILFSAPMVRALLAGTKTQTRRIVKPPIGGINWGKRCPYGQPGDRLWVREKWAPVTATAYRMSDGVQQTVNPNDEDTAAIYAAGWDRSGPGRWRPSIHMPRWASRITLEVTGVRVERLQEISPADACAEGAAEILDRPHADPLRSAAYDKFGVTLNDGERYAGSVAAYAALWESINGPGSWDANPWVWVVEFKRVDA